MLRTAEDLFEQSKFFEKALKKNSYDNLIKFCNSAYLKAFSRAESAPDNHPLKAALIGFAQTLLEISDYVTTGRRPVGMSDSDFNKCKSLATKIVDFGQWKREVLDNFK